MDHPAEINFLIDRCLSGEPAAIETLIDSHQAAVRRLALSILDDPDEADEAAQDVFIAVLKNLDGFDPDGSFQGWLATITVNICRSRLRKMGARRRLRERLQDENRLTGGGTFSGEDACIQRETQSVLWQAVSRLDERHRLPLVLRYASGLPVNRIAEILNIRPGTVHSRLHHARRRLQAALDALEKKGNS